MTRKPSASKDNQYAKRRQTPRDIEKELFRRCVPAPPQPYIGGKVDKDKRSDCGNRTIHPVGICGHKYLIVHPAHFVWSVRTSHRFHIQTLSVKKK